MIFQYTRVFSEIDAKRHYRWECVSRDYEHAFVFLTPNGNRLRKVFDNFVPPNGVVHSLRSFAERLLLNPSANLDVYNKLIIDYPMLPYIEVCEFQNNNGLTIYEHSLRSDVECMSFMTIIQDCHICLLSIEIELLQLDEENQSKQQTSAFWNELTNVLAKVDSTSFLSNCLQQLNVTDKKESQPIVPSSPQPIIPLTQPKQTVKRHNRPFQVNELTGVKRVKRDVNCVQLSNRMM